jgi:hypothetical protein
MSNPTVMTKILTQSKQAVMPVKHSDMIGWLRNDELWMKIRANS